MSSSLSNSFKQAFDNISKIGTMGQLYNVDKSSNVRLKMISYSKVEDSDEQFTQASETTYTTLSVIFGSSSKIAPEVGCWVKIKKTLYRITKLKEINFNGDVIGYLAEVQL